MVRLVFATMMACCIATAIADAKPRTHRIAVLEFDGAHELADAGRAAVLLVLGGVDAAIVPAKTWSDALARASSHGPDRWKLASNWADVDVVVEGWVEKDGRRDRLTVAVRDAATGTEVGMFSVAIDAHGVPAKETQTLASNLRDTIGQIPTSERAPDSSDRRDRNPDDERGSDNSDRRADRNGERGSDKSDRRPDRNGERGSDKSDRRPDRNADGERKRNKRIATDRKDEVATDSDVVVDPVTRAPRFEIAAGPYVSGRGLAFSHGPDGVGSLPSYPGHTAGGIALHANAFPLPREGLGQLLSGPGVTLDLRKSLGSSITSDGYSVSELAWELDAQYRLLVPAARLTVAVDFGGGGVAHRLVNRPASVAIPSTSHSYVGGGAYVEFAATDTTTVGAGARYMYMLGLGEMGDASWYGAGLAAGAMGDLDGTIAINEWLYLQGMVEYRRVAIAFDGSGAKTQMTGRMNVLDSALSGVLTLGARY